jgi:hypothetical protein
VLRNRLTSTGSLGSINSTLETATGVWISPVIVGCKRVLNSLASHHSLYNEVLKNSDMTSIHHSSRYIPTSMSFKKFTDSR